MGEGPPRLGRESADKVVAVNAKNEGQLAMWHGGKENSLLMCNTLHTEFAIIRANLLGYLARVSSFPCVGYTGAWRLFFDVLGPYRARIRGWDYNSIALCLSIAHLGSGTGT